MTRRHTHRASIIRYVWTCPEDYDGPTPWEYPIDDRLMDEWRDGFVESFDTGRGRVVWFTCPAGKRARGLRDWVRAQLPTDWTAGEPE